MRLYIHWPFCVSRCAYCDFNSRVASRELHALYHHALITEIENRSRCIGEERRDLGSLYLGGGTPSIMKGEEVARFLEEVFRYFRRGPGTEVTVEVNPADWCAGDFIQAREGGVNRFSMGVQSLSDDVLAFLGRRHSANQAVEAMRSALASDADVSADLLCALPAAGRLSASDSLSDVLDLGPHHISLYGLTLEKSTPLAKRVELGEVALPGEDEAADEYLALVSTLGERGYEQYEISNFSRPGYESRHNLAYWSREEYLGVGAGAHSLIAERRFSNRSSVLQYIENIKSGGSTLESYEVLNLSERESEEIMLGLRTTAGVREELVGHSVDGLEALGLIVRRLGRIRLTPSGMLVSNTIIAGLLPDVDSLRCA
ncbi:MAG: hypothetical protein A2V52_01500 [Actinobacteria bacterium RBG_19FT_COMBO_54_7]|nr:MAG: hypothetical protein A2V52_01500 [Actinobacteria bacterium RBG_19FT_COMBO_54_7]